MQPQQPPPGPRYPAPQQQWAPPLPPPYQQPPSRRRKKGPAGKVALIVVGVIAVLIGLVAVLGDGEEQPAASVATPTASRTAPFVSGVPKPDGQQTEDLLAGLRQIDRELDRARSVDRARNTCSDLLAGEKRSSIVEKTRLRFDGTAQIDTADAQAIVKLIQEGGWCR